MKKKNKRGIEFINLGIRFMEGKEVLELEPP